VPSVRLLSFFAHDPAGTFRKLAYERQENHRKICMTIIGIRQAHWLSFRKSEIDGICHEKTKKYPFEVPGQVLAHEHHLMKVRCCRSA
jgi:hypothetical protein